MMPFDGGIDSIANGSLILSAVAAFLYLLKEKEAPSVRRTILKTASILLLAVIAAVEGGPILLVIALLLSALGDALLAQDGERMFLGGLASFLAGHLAYVALFLSMAALPAFFGEIWRPLAAVLIVSGAVGVFLWLRSALPGNLVVPVAVYTVAIAAMGLAALGVDGPVFFGALLFMASDTILAGEKFRFRPNSTHRAWARPAVWILYWLAQVAILLSVLAVTR